jgi:hypothetical protein
MQFSRYRPKKALADPEGYGFRIFSTFGTVKVVFTPRSFPGTHFQRLNRSETLRLVAQCLNHYATQRIKLPVM